MRFKGLPTKNPPKPGPAGPGSKPQFRGITPRPKPGPAERDIAAVEALLRHPVDRSWISRWLQTSTVAQIVEAVADVKRAKDAEHYGRLISWKLKNPGSTPPGKREVPAREVTVVWQAWESVDPEYERMTRTKIRGWLNYYPLNEVLEAVNFLGAHPEVIEIGPATSLAKQNKTFLTNAFKFVRVYLWNKRNPFQKSKD